MSIDVTEESILDALHKVPRDHWSEVLEFLHDMEPKAGQASDVPETKHWTATELRHARRPAGCDPRRQRLPWRNSTIATTPTLGL